MVRIHYKRNRTAHSVGEKEKVDTMGIALCGDCERLFMLKDTGQVDEKGKYLCNNCYKKEERRKREEEEYYDD